MEADPLLAEEDRPAVLQPDERSEDEQQRAEDDQCGRCDDDVQQALDGDPEDPIRSVDQRQDLHAVEVLDPAAGDDHRRLRQRDPDDPALVLAQPRDRLDEGPVLVAEADRHLVDHGSVQDVLDLVHGPEDRSPPVPAGGQRRVIRSGQVADRPEAEFDVALDRIGERLGRWVGADHEDVPGVVAACAEPDEEGPDRGPRDQCQDCLEREEEEQEEAADVGELEQVERGEDHDREEQDRDEDVDDLAADRQARPEAVEPLEPQGADEDEPVGCSRREGVDADRRPDVAPSGSTRNGRSTGRRTGPSRSGHRPPRAPAEVP